MDDRYPRVGTVSALDINLSAMIIIYEMHLVGDSVAIVANGTSNEDADEWITQCRKEQWKRRSIPAIRHNIRAVETHF